MAANWPDFVQRGPVVNTADVEYFERRFGITLTEDYRQFLLDVNGGRTAKECRRFDAGVLNGLLTLNPPEEMDFNDLSSWNERMWSDLGTKDLLVVGYDDGGARILVALSGEHRGEVWMQITTDARPADANPRVEWHDRRDMRKLADSFEAFLGSLRPLT